MEDQKILNLLNNVSDSKFVTRKWSIASDSSKANYKAGNEIAYKAKVLKSNLCDYNDAYILVRGDITVQHLVRHKQHLKIVHNLLNVSQKLIEQQ